MQIEKVFEWGCITSIGEIFIDPYNFQYIYNKVTISNKRKKEISNLIFSFFFPPVKSPIICDIYIPFIKNQLKSTQVRRIIVHKSVGGEVKCYLQHIYLDKLTTSHEKKNERERDLSFNLYLL